MFYVIHIHSYAHRIIRQDDDGDDVQRYSSCFLFQCDKSKVSHRNIQGFITKKIVFSFKLVAKSLLLPHRNDGNTFLFPLFPVEK